MNTPQPGIFSYDGMESGPNSVQTDNDDICLLLCFVLSFLYALAQIILVNPEGTPICRLPPSLSMTTCSSVSKFDFSFQIA
jgi:hypothetical protein